MNSVQKQNSPTYIKAMSLKDPSDIHSIKEDIKKNIILILRVTPLAQKDVGKLREIIDAIYATAKAHNADIARLGEERIIIAPANIKIWKPQYDLK